MGHLVDSTWWSQAPRHPPKAFALHQESSANGIEPLGGLRMTTGPRATDQLIAWLDDAYAMETGMVSILQNHAAHFGSALPTSARRLQLHIVETQQHADRVRECLRLLDARPSGVKSSLSSMIGAVEGAATAVFRDQLVKDALADYAAEQFEVGCYTALVGAATALGYPNVAKLCRQNLDEDQAMATWLLQQIPATVTNDIAHSTTSSRA
jgi:ferritin-like metal-binding protein YciE